MLVAGFVALAVAEGLVDFDFDFDVEAEGDGLLAAVRVVWAARRRPGTGRR